MRTQPLLVVEHQADCPPAWMGEWLRDAGVDLDVRRPYLGDELPSDLSAHGGLLVLGGSMDAYSDVEFPWLSTTKHLLRVAAGDGTPTLGICLGHQLAAVALGGEVRRSPRGQQMGVVGVGWRPGHEDDALVGDLGEARYAVQWNNDITTRLPSGAVVLAETAQGEVQAARFAQAMWGVQWHPEVGAEIVRSWAEKDRLDAVARGVDVDERVADIAAAETGLRESWSRLAVAFAKQLANRVVRR